MPILKQLISWSNKKLNQIVNPRIRISLMQAIPFWIASLLVGLIAVGYALLFAGSEKLAFSVFEEYPESMFIITPLCLLLSTSLVKWVAPYARGSGIPQVMASIDLSTTPHNKKIGLLLNFRVLVVKIASSLVNVLGGGPIGREGPTIQIAGSIFYLINKIIHSSWHKVSVRTMIMTGASAGLAAAFNTPLGGIVFAVEELTKTHISYFRTALFSAVIIAGLTAQGLLGSYLYLGFPAVADLSPYILTAVVLVGIIGGLAGGAMSGIILKLLRLKTKFIRPRYNTLVVLMCGILIAAIAYFIDIRIIGSGKELMTGILFTDEKYVDWYVPILRMSGPIIAFMTGSAGGIFAPSLAAGASIGSVFSSLFDVSSPENVNLLILAGMTAYLTGVTRTPFTAAILVLEMTDRHSVIFYLMVAALVANLAALVIDKKSFYDRLSKQYLAEVEKDPSGS